MIIKYSKKIKYHSFYNGELWASKKKHIIKSSDEGENWERVTKVKALSFLSNFSIYNRLTRNGIYNILNIKDNIYAIVIKRKILYYNNDQLIKTFKIDRGSRPLRQGIVNLKGNIIYGDYWDNPMRTSANVNIIDGNTLEQQVLLSLEGVRHIHFLIPSKINEDIIFIGTGDLDQECNIFQYNIKKKSLERVGGGDQNWRAVSLIQRGNEIYWGTDAPNDKNFIFKFDLENKKLTKLIEVDGPIFYSAETKNGDMIFTSIVEYRDIHKAKMYVSNDGLSWNKKYEWKKDPLSLYWFGFGVIDLIRGQESLNNIFINLNGLKN